MTSASFVHRSLRGLVRLAWPVTLALGALQPAQAIDLADQPLFSTVSVPGNLVLALSVEWPTANTTAYFNSPAYASANEYLGYFDPLKCYKYVYNSATPASSYFTPDSVAAVHVCSSDNSHPRWSGNYLNWSSMQSLDIFRWVLTGGNRLVDDSNSTILQKTFHTGQDSGNSAPNKTLASTVIAGATPFNWAGGLKSRIWGAGVRMFVTGSADLTVAATTITGAATTANYDTQNSYTSTPTSNSTIYVLYMNVKACDTGGGTALEANCVAYGSKAKPEGLMQQYAGQLRYSAFGYLNDSSILRDGGVLRAGMKYIAPLQPVPGSASIANTLTEWDGSTGIMGGNPNPTDASATSSAATAAGYSVSIAQSGVMNYLNKFGYAAQIYKSKDPVSEMYYAAIRYMKNQSQVPEYSSLAGGGSAIATWLDGFPVVTSPPDPIAYTCQKNFILGIGDVNTHRDSNLPGSTLVPPAGNEPAQPAAVAADTTVNVTTATNLVGTIEGVSNLGTTFIAGGRYDSYFIAGLAYDSHINDIRPDPAQPGKKKQTIDTYWLDVLENQAYVCRNIYYYATKYGGFKVPTGYVSGGALPLNSWYNNTDTQASCSPVDKRPDNYFTANNPAAMRSGLTTAFANISAAAAAANSTAFSSPSPNVTSVGSVSYAATYDPTSWTGNVTASTVSFAADGTPTLTPAWDGRALLSAASMLPTARKIVTCCTTATSSYGLTFETTTLSAGPLISRTNYTSFGAVPGVSSQSAANFVSYLRGDTTKELAGGGVYRTRAFRLGDIVDSKPVAVGAPSYGFFDASNPGYSAFKSLYATRQTVVYAGSNDGMLHAFDGSVGATGGTELFAYIPSFVYGTTATAPVSGLASLGNPNFTHHFLVDGTPGQFDVNFNKTDGATGTAPDWRTLLIGGLGKGGAGYYALDVTDPTSWSSESAVAGKVLWEFTDSRMGYSFGQPSVVKTAKYGWVVVLTSGYNNSDGKGWFFFVNPRTGALLEAVSTPTSATSPVDLAQQTAYVADYTDMTADAVYAGDLQGNLWRVDITATGTTAFPAPKLIATFASGGHPQPVTTRPLVEIQPISKTRYVLVGTGRLLADTDVSSSQTQSFYAIVDGTATSGAFYTDSTLPTGVTFPIDRSKLNANTDLAAGIPASPTSAMGWYFDLPVTTTVPAIAQRVNVDPIANTGIVAFVGNTPNGSACSPSGTGSLYAVTFAGGKSVLQNASGVQITSSTPVDGILTDIAILNVAGKLRLYAGGSTGAVANAPANLTTGAGLQQLNWRDVPMGN